MSSEVFSNAYIQAQRKQRLAREIRRDIANVTQSIKKISASMENANRILKEQGSAIAQEAAGKGMFSAIDARLKETINGQADISGFTAKDISQLAETVRKNTALLDTKGTIIKDNIDETSALAIGLSKFELQGEETVSGYVKTTDISINFEEANTYETKKIIELSEILQGAKSKKDTEYMELLIVAYGILDEPLWTSQDIKYKENAIKKIERIDSNKSLTVFEKIDKVKAILDEFVKSKAAIPDDIDAKELTATYKVLCRKLKKTVSRNIPLNSLETEIEKMTEELIAIEEQQFISRSIVEAFEEEGILLDCVKSAEETQVYYLEDAADCEIVINNVDGGFLMETVGLYEEGKNVTTEDKANMKESAKKVCEKYKKVIERLAEKGIIIGIVSEDDPETYLKISSESETTFARRKKDTKTSKERRERRREKKLKTFD